MYTVHTKLQSFTHVYYVLYAPSPPCIQSGNAVSLAKPTEEGVLEPTTDRRSTLSPEVNKIPPLDKHFKKPPPLKNRRTPSKQHLKQMAAGSGEDEEMDGECVCVCEVWCGLWRNTIL